MEGNEIKPARVVPSKPGPYIPSRPAPSKVPPPLPSTHATPSHRTSPVPGRKPPPSGPPPPLPPRMDLGEAGENVANSFEGKSSNGFMIKESLKLKPKGRPEISIVSARPMDPSGVIPSPSVPSPPAPAFEGPKAPQRPGRKSKGREPPPRPKSRPVSELVPEADEQDGRSVTGKLKGIEAVSNKDDKAMIAGKYPGLKGAPVVPERKAQDHITDANVEEKSELSDGIESSPVQENERVKTISTEPTVVNGKPVENKAAPPVEIDGVKETRLDKTGVSVENAVALGKKTKPDVVMAKGSKKSPPLSQEPGEKIKNEGETDVIKDEKLISASNKEGKPPPPAKKPKPALKPKPISLIETPCEVYQKKADSVELVAPRPKPKATVILPAKPPKVTEIPKPSDSQIENVKDNGEGRAQGKPSKSTVILPARPKNSEPPKVSESASGMEERSTQVKRSKPTIILPDRPTNTQVPSATGKEERSGQVKTSRSTGASEPSNGSKGKDERTSEKSFLDVSEGGVPEEGRVQEQTVAKPKRVPTIIRAPRPEGEEGQDTGQWRKQPKRPQRGPSVRKPAPPRPVITPPEENKEKEKSTSQTQQESDAEVPVRVTEKKQEKKPRPPRPVSMAGPRQNGNLVEAPKSHDVDSPVEDEINLKRNGSRKRPAPPRPPAAEAVRGEVEPTVEASGKVDHKDKPKGKSRPARPTSRVLDSTASKHVPEETGESHLIRPKPARPAPVAGRRNDTETQSVGETSVGDHVKGTPETRDSGTLEKAASKAKPKPPRPAPSSVSAKNKPRRPSGPTAKPGEKVKEEVASTQVSTVRETYIEPSAVALHDYEPTAIDDLAFSAGDEIVLVQKVDNEWYVGRLGEQQGMFPVKFVEIIEDLPEEVTEEAQPVAPPESSAFDVIALYDFQGNKHDGELVFIAGEVIQVTEKINDDWLRGEYRGQTGSFPCNFVDISTDVINKLPLSKTNVTAAASDQTASADQSGRVLQCKALFDYNTDVPDDLSFSTGDVIKVRKKVGDEWIEGELNGKAGMFPAAYVEMVEDVQEGQTESTMASTVEFASAIYDFTGSASDELSFAKGDKIEITEVISDDWLRGKLREREGMFPRTFVEVSKESVAKSQPARKDCKVTPKAKALFDFDGEYEDELSFKVGNMIILLERVNEEWLRGKSEGRIGRFPASFVEIVTPLT